MDWKKLLAYITGSVDEELLLRNEHLVTENRIMRAQIKGRLKLTDGKRRTLAEIGEKLGKKVLAKVASIVKPETILAWHRRLVARKFDGSKNRIATLHKPVPVLTRVRAHDRRERQSRHRSRPSFMPVRHGRAGERRALQLLDDG